VDSKTAPGHTSRAGLTDSCCWGFILGLVNRIPFILLALASRVKEVG
jgi:hypothetical protein